MKKLFAVLLALLLALSMVSALAEGVDPRTEFYITKGYTLGNEGIGTAPAETLAFDVVGVSVTDAAEGIAIGDYLPTVDGSPVDGTSSIKVTLPTYESVGVYTYTITEKEGSTAGVTYTAKDTPITLVVTVANGESGFVCYPVVKLGEGAEEEKTTTITNTYTAGELAVKKVVTGELGDKNKDFNVTVTFTAPEGKTVAGAITWTDGETAGSATFTNGEATAYITLKHDEKVTFTNIPYGVTYTVVEDDYTGEGYDEAEYSEFDGEINSAKDEVTITNNKGAEIDTGITTDSMPYIVLMGIVVLAGVAMIAKRRAANND